MGGQSALSGPAGGQFPNQGLGGGVGQPYTNFQLGAQSTLPPPQVAAIQPQFQRQIQPQIQPQPQPQPQLQRQPALQQVNFQPALGRNPSSTPIAATQAQIADVQIKLYSLNINPGPPNGILGLETTNAIAFFQRRAGIRVDGSISPNLIFQLDRAANQAAESRRLR
ncbi:MAG: peptidoglycan-binding domain-containing protein [Alphaproteobacteria bacterium]|nr:peptidoglycan-binding domain-containing protein [Alphaproteobacteria bacterium]